MGSTKLSDATLARILESGEWSDLTIYTATKDFCVHKVIVCPACPFFQAACARDFKEAHTGIIELRESDATVNGILRHFYGLPAGELSVQDAQATNIDHIRECVDLHVAADKKLRDLTTITISTYLSCTTSHANLADAAVYVNRQDLSTITESIFVFLESILTTNLTELYADAEAWAKLLEDRQLLDATLDYLMKTLGRIVSDEDYRLLRPGTKLEEQILTLHQGKFIQKKDLWEV